MEYVLVLAVLAVALQMITGPLRRARTDLQSRGSSTLETLAELESARDAKYLEIRDAELDLRTGKLSQEDYEALDGALRAEAVAILHRLDLASRSAEQAPGSEPIDGDGGTSPRGPAGGRIPSQP